MSSFISVYSLLRTAEELGIRKPVKPEFGGGNKEFVYDDQDYFIGTEDDSSFLTSQERQSIVRHMLYSLQARQGEKLGKLRFIEGQAIGMCLEVLLLS
jgi:anoctamin-8